MLNDLALETSWLADRAVDRASWIWAAEVAADAGPEVVPVPPNPQFKFQLGASFARQRGGDKIIRDLADDRSVRPYLVSDALVLGCGFIVFSDDHFVRETKYLAEDNLEARVGHSLRDPVLELADDKIWIVGGNGSPKNYWHLLAQVLPAIAHSRKWLAEIGVTSVGLIVPKLLSWQRQALELSGLAEGLEVVELTVFQSAKARQVVYSPYLSGGAAFTSSPFRAEVRARMLSVAGPKPTTPSRFFVSRRDSKKRPLLNEAEVADCLAAFGFAVVCPGELPVAEQVNLFAAAEIVVAPHGAGSANYLFLSPGARVLELQQAGWINAGPLSMCKTSGAEAIADVFPDVRPGAPNEGWRVDVPVLRRAAASLVKSRKGLWSSLWR